MRLFDNIPLAKAKAELSRNFKKVALAYDVNVFADRKISERIQHCLDQYRSNITDQKFDEQRRGGGVIVAAVALADSLQSPEFEKSLTPLMHGVFIRTLKELNDIGLKKDNKLEYEELHEKNRTALKLIGEKAMETVQPSITGLPQKFMILDACDIDRQVSVHKTAPSPQDRNDNTLSVNYARESISLPFGVVAKQSKASQQTQRRQLGGLSAPGM